MPPSSSRETYKLAHTARCKLQMAADRPDRDLRFILGHAFTLDKLLLRVVEIERDGSISDDEDDGALPTCTEARPRRVSFKNGDKPRAGSLTRPKSPPLQDAQLSSDEDSSGSDDDGIEDDEEDDDGLSLQRFGSATAKPPRMIEDDGEEEDVDEPKSPTQEEILAITAGPESAEFEELYNGVKGCPCHGKGGHAPAVEKAWEVPQKQGWEGNRFAVVQVAA